MDALSGTKQDETGTAPLQLVLLIWWLFKMCSCICVFCLGHWPFTVCSDLSHSGTRSNMQLQKTDDCYSEDFTWPAVLQLTYIRCTWGFGPIRENSHVLNISAMKILWHNALNFFLWRACQFIVWQFFLVHLMNSHTNFK